MIQYKRKKIWLDRKHKKFCWVRLYADYEALMIEEYTHAVRRLWRKDVFETRYTIYHESPAFDGSVYQARCQISATGEKNVVVAYLHGIINGAVHYSEKLLKKIQYQDEVIEQRNNMIIDLKKSK